MKCDGGNESDSGDCANDGDDHDSGNESDNDDGGNGNELMVPLKVMVAIGKTIKAVANYRYWQ